ncbi:porin family protein [Labrys sp. KNU-23]|nr:porin family protein [Labrys sp. KNU-23]
MGWGYRRHRVYEFQEFTMKKLLLATAVTLITGSAFAADIPQYQEPAPAYQAPASNVTWTGFYAGINLGYGFSGDFDADRGVRLNEASGFTGGVQAGYNMQYDPIVVGLEGSLNYADITDKYDGHKGTYGFNGSITPRLGYAMGDFLPYIKAGLAFGDVEINRFGAKDSQWQVGWTAGFGAEYRVTPEVSVRAEYNYTSYGKDDFDIRSGIVKAGYSGSDIKVGVNYHF